MARRLLQDGLINMIKIMTPPVYTVKSLLDSGANVSISADAFLAHEINDMASVARKHGLRLTIKDAGKLQPFEAKSVAQKGGEHVTFEF